MVLEDVGFRVQGPFVIQDAEEVLLVEIALAVGQRRQPFVYPFQALPAQVKAQLFAALTEGVPPAVFAQD